MKDETTYQGSGRVVSQSGFSFKLLIGHYLLLTGDEGIACIDSSK